VATVHFEDRTVAVDQDQTVLDALLGAGIDVPFSCKVGCCHSCLMRAIEGTPPPVSQHGLKATLIEQGYFLACMAERVSDLTVSTPDGAAVSVPARIVEISPLGQNVVSVRLETDGEFEYRPGQFLNLIRSDGLTRSYSLASVPEQDSQLELHVRQIPDGRMSGWLCTGEALDEGVQIRGPAGECFYAGDAAENLLLVGTGTGLAPLWGIARDAIGRGHKGRITLYHGALDSSGLYLVDQLRALADQVDSFEYKPCVVRGEETEGIAVGAIDELVLGAEDVRSSRVYLCGDPNLVNSLRKKFFLAGASLERIHADAFVTSAG
jgi:CDP-4-dehydro-6-deoxyglucose reductase